MAQKEAMFVPDVSKPLSDLFWRQMSQWGNVKVTLHSLPKVSVCCDVSLAKGGPGGLKGAFVLQKPLFYPFCLLFEIHRNHSI